MFRDGHLQERSKIISKAVRSPRPGRGAEYPRLPAISQVRRCPPPSLRSSAGGDERTDWTEPSRASRPSADRCKRDKRRRDGINEEGAAPPAPAGAIVRKGNHPERGKKRPTATVSPAGAAMMKHRAAAHTLRYCARPWALRQNKGRQLALGTQHYTTLSELAVASADPGLGGSWIGGPSSTPALSTTHKA